MKQCGVYCIQSKIIPNRIYIGSSVNMSERIRTHFCSLRNKNHYNKKMQNHVNKYGIDDLSWFFVSNCSRDRLINEEQFYIDILNPYFNIRIIANSNKGRKFSEETRRRMSEAAYKLWETEDRIEKGRDYLKRKWQDEQYRDKIKNVAKRTWESEDHRIKMSQNAKNQWSDPEYVLRKSKEKKEWWLVDENKEKMISILKQRRPSEEVRIRISKTLTGRKWSDSQMQKNKDKDKKNGASLFWGVTYSKKNRNWRCCYVLDKKSKHIGVFETEIEAAIAREHFILINGIENQRLNKISSTGEPRYVEK